MRKAEIREKFDAIVAFAEVEKFIDTPVKHYSSGMYVRLGFSIAVHNEPEILLVDEVLAVGDLSFQRKCFEKMQELKASGRTFILISHSMAHIASLCERAIMLKNGRLVADGLPADVTRTYVEEADTHSGKIVINGGASGVDITNVRLLDRNGEPTIRLEMGEPMTFEIEYSAAQPISSCYVSIHIERGQLRVYDSSTRGVGIRLDTLMGKGMLRCQIPNLPIIANSYGVHAVIYSADERSLAHVRYPRMFTIIDSKDASFIGYDLADEASARGIVYGKATWVSLALG